MSSSEFEVIERKREATAQRSLLLWRVILSFLEHLTLKHWLIPYATGLPIHITVPLDLEREQCWFFAVCSYEEMTDCFRMCAAYGDREMLCLSLIVLPASASQSRRLYLTRRPFLSLSLTTELTFKSSWIIYFSCFYILLSFIIMSARFVF